jgi:RNA polymerase sigma factor (sigma-70 family)
MNANTLVRRCLTALTAGEPSPGDAELLARFTAGRDPDAFAELVRRHGPIVLAACRRVLGQSADAEDAFQATFLALARHAGSIRGAAALPAWLHRTALRAANRVRSHERTTVSPPTDPADCRDPFADVAWRDLRRVLDEELDRLPERYRAPVVLCLLGGLTRDEAAEQIGYSLNTLKRRLEAGRSLLRDRLLRRGVAPLVLAAGLLDGDGLRAQVPERLIDAVVRSAPATASVASGSVATLSARGVALAACVAIGVVGMLLEASTRQFPPGLKSPSPSSPAFPSAGDGPPDALGDPLPAGALLRIGTSRYRDGGSTNEAILSPDGKTVATASEAGIMLFDLATGKRTHWITDSGVPNGASPNYARFAFSPDGKRLFTLSGPYSSGAAAGTAGPHTIAAYELPSGKRADTFKPVLAQRDPQKPPRQGYTRLWFPDGSKLLVAVRDGTTVLIEPIKGEEVSTREFEAHAVVGTPDGLRFFVISKGATSIAVHDRAGQLLRTLDHTEVPTLLGFDPAGTVLAAVGKQAQVRVWNLADGKELGAVEVPEKEGGDYSINSLAVTPDKKTILAGTHRGVIYRIDLATGKELPPLKGHTSWVNSLLFADQGNTLVTAGWSHAVLRFDLATGKAIADAGGYVGYLNVDRSPDGGLMAAADYTGLVELLDGKTGKRIRLLQESGKPAATRVAFAPDGTLLATGHQDGRIRLWESSTGKLAREIELGKPVKERSAWFEALVFTADGKSIASCARGFGLRLNEVETGKSLWDDPGGEGKIAFLPSGRRLVTGGWDDKLTTRDIRTGKPELVAATTGRHVIDDIAVSPDGRLLATGHHDGFVCLRDPATGAVRKEWQAHEPGQVTWGVAFGPGGIWLATAGDRTVKVWDTLTGTLLRKFEGHTSRAWSPKFSRDGRTLLSTSLDLTGYVWEVPPALGKKDERTTEQLWDDLNGKPEAAFRAVWLAAADPAAPELFGKKLPSPPKPDVEQFKKLVEGLSSSEFREREAAEKALTAFGPAAIGLAKKARADSDSQEVRTRLDRVMKGWTESALDPEVWRRKRAVVALELAGTEEARNLLARWAADAPGTMLSDDAAGALQRMEGRGR